MINKIIMFSTTPAPFYINGDCVERVQTIKFLGTIISADLKWLVNTTAIIKKAQQHLHFLSVKEEQTKGEAAGEWSILPMYLLCFRTLEHFSCVAVYGGSDSSLISSKTS